MAGTSTTNMMSTSRWPQVAMDVVSALAAVAAIAALVLELGGFDLADAELKLIRLAQAAAVAVFLAIPFLRLQMASSPRRHFGANWLDFLLIGLSVLGVAVVLAMQPDSTHVGATILTLTQVFLVLMISLRAVGLVFRVSAWIGPTATFVCGLVFLSMAGSGLLMLPQATHAVQDHPVYYIDVLFTSISAVCMAGLTTRNIGGDFTPFGQAVILALIQLGGLSVLLYGTVLIKTIARSLSGADGRLGEADAECNTRNSGVVAVVLAVFAIEIIGAVLLYPMFIESDPTQGRPAEAAWYAIFYSVSAFCNAGFSLFSRNLMQGANQGADAALRERWQLLGVIAPLIVIGGLGVSVWADCATCIKRAAKRVFGGGGSTACEPAGNLSLHSRAVLASTAMLIVFGALGLILIEPVTEANARVKGAYGANIGGAAVRDQNDWYALGNAGRVKQAVFQSISARTGGFSTIDCGLMSNGGKLWMCGLMTVGASPAGTGGGMKTVTLVILLAGAYSVLRRRGDVALLDRRLPPGLLRKGMTLAMLYLAMVGAITMLMCIFTDPQENFIDILFESSSACGAVGLSTGLTAKLGESAKTTLMVGMFLGRIGPMAAMMYLAARPSRAGRSYSEEHVVLG